MILDQCPHCGVRSVQTTPRFAEPLNARDGAVLPVLHLNGYKIANPTILARIPQDELASLFNGYGYEPFLVAGTEPVLMHQALAATLDACVDSIAAIQRAARQGHVFQIKQLGDSINGCVG